MLNIDKQQFKEHSGNTIIFTLINNNSTQFMTNTNENMF